MVFSVGGLACRDPSGGTADQLEVALHEPASNLGPEPGVGARATAVCEGAETRPYTRTNLNPGCKALALESWRDVRADCSGWQVRPAKVSAELDCVGCVQAVAAAVPAQPAVTRAPRLGLWSQTRADACGRHIRRRL